MKITPRTGLYVPVERFTEPPDHIPDPSPILDTESRFNFWLLALMAIAAVGSIGLMFGWFRTPSQALTAENQKLTQQLAQAIAQQKALNQSINDFCGGRK
jgi:3-deoxy-D-arabino-heptulosonate 7-phosphate (DAHP) synthase